MKQKQIPPSSWLDDGMHSDTIELIPGIGVYISQAGRSRGSPRSRWSDDGFNYMELAYKILVSTDLEERCSVMCQPDELVGVNRRLRSLSPPREKESFM